MSEKRQRIDGTPQPIPMTEFAAYVIFNGIADEFRRSLMFRIVSSLDAVYMRNHWEQAAKAASKRK